MMSLSPEQVRKKVLSGTSWITLLEAATRLFGLVSFIILARLLAPEAFGLMSIATTVTATLEMATAVGIARALIQKAGPVEEYFNSLWSFWILRSVGIFLLMWFLAPYAALYFKLPESTALIRWVGVSLLINGLGNPATINLNKYLDYKKIFLMNGAGQLVSFIVTIMWAFIAPSVWALIGGAIVRDVMIVVMSYRLVPYRPHWTWKIRILRPFFGFGLWNTAINFSQKLIDMVDIAIVGRWLGPANLGFYAKGRSLGFLPYQGGRQIFFKIGFPTYALLQKDPEKVRNGFRKSLALYLFLTIPFLILALTLGDFLIPFVLGEIWSPMIQPFQILLGAGIMRGFLELANPLFQGLGRPHLHFLLNAILLVISTFAVWTMASSFGIVGVSWGILGAATIAALIAIWYVQKLLKLSFADWFYLNPFNLFRSRLNVSK